jgi:oligopeptide/dipeptide ABC transporter ATP-binding protein
MTTQTTLEVTGLRVSYPERRRTPGSGGRFVAVQGVDLTVGAGEAHGLVGESGSGKSTLARAVAGVVPIEAGSVRVGGVDLGRLRAEDPVAAARRVQMVFQDVSGALDPRQRIGSALREVLRVHGLEGDDGGATRIASLLGEVGLPDAFADRYPHQLSGGQRQRVGIARALAVEPDVLVLDEPVSALDVSVQARILELLDRLRRDRGVGVLLIAHDLAVVRNVCHSVSVLYRGRIVEAGPTRALFDGARHPYTRDLLAAVPRLAVMPEATPAYRMTEDEPREAGKGDGCPYAHRCAHSARDSECERAVPPLDVVDPRHVVACWKERSEAISGG